MRQLAIRNKVSSQRGNSLRLTVIGNCNATVYHRQSTDALQEQNGSRRRVRTFKAIHPFHCERFFAIRQEQIAEQSEKCSAGIPFLQIQCICRDHTTGIAPDNMDWTKRGVLNVLQRHFAQRLKLPSKYGLIDIDGQFLGLEQSRRGARAVGQAFCSSRCSTESRWTWPPSMWRKFPDCERARKQPGDGSQSRATPRTWYRWSDSCGITHSSSACKR